MCFRHKPTADVGFVSPWLLMCVLAITTNQSIVYIPTEGWITGGHYLKKNPSTPFVCLLLFFVLFCFIKGNSSVSSSARHRGGVSVHVKAF